MVKVYAKLAGKVQDTRKDIQNIVIGIGRIKMTDGQPNIIGPIGGLVGLGVMAYGAKAVIDVLKDKAQEHKKKKPLYQEPLERSPRITASDDRVTRGLNKMLGR
jgi:hypothetical protein